jgi:hypothetical protein
MPRRNHKTHGELAVQKRPQPAGRRDNLDRVAAVVLSAAEAGLRAVLAGIARDRQAGPWGPWAEGLLAAEAAEGSARAEEQAPRK